MNNKVIWITIVVLILLGVWFYARAEQCGNNTDPITGDTYFISCGGGNPYNIGMPWGLTGKDVPIIKPGTVITDERGFRDICPDRYPKWGCVDISHTDYYRTKMGYK